MAVYGNTLVEGEARASAFAPARHAAPTPSGLFARVARFVRELPGRRLGAQRATPVHSDSHAQWLRSIASAVSQGTRLQNAVDANDVSAARRALRAGADPNDVRLGPATSPEVAELIGIARKISLLYRDRAFPSQGAQTPALSPIDALVLDYDVEGARVYLDKLSSDPAWLWSAARRGGKEDLMRAILAVTPEATIRDMARTPADAPLAAASGVPQTNSSLAKLNGMTCTATVGFLHAGIERGAYSRALTDYLASIPGLDPAPVLDLNKGDRGVWCRHWATLWLEKAVAAAPHEPIDYSLFFAHDDLLAHHTVSDLEQRYEALRGASKEVCFVANGLFGQFAADHFARMKDGESRHWMVNTPAHAMALELERRSEGGETVYLARLYDPNVTTSHVAAETRDLSVVDGWHFEAFLHHEVAPRYFDKTDRMVLMTALPEGGIPDAVPAHDPTRRVAGSYGVDALRSPTAVWHLFDMNLTAELAALPDVMAGMNSEQAVEVLSMQPEGRFASAFFQAAGRSNPLTFDRYVAALQGCDPSVKDTIMSRLVVEFHRFVTTLQVPGTIDDFARFLSAMGWDGQALGMLFSMPVRSGGSMMYSDLCNGRSGNVTAIGSAMLRYGTPAEQWKSVLGAAHGGVPGLAVAVNAGHIETLRAYARVLQNAPLGSAERADLLRGAYQANGWQHYALSAAYHGNRPEAVAVYGEMLAACLEPPDAAALMTEILCARDAGGVAFFRPGVGETVQPETRLALVEAIARFPFSVAQAERIQAATGMNVLAGDERAGTRFIPRQARRSL